MSLKERTPDVNYNINSNKFQCGVNSLVAFKSLFDPEVKPQIKLLKYLVVNTIKEL